MIASVTFSTNLLASFTRKSPSMTRRLASTTNLVSPKSIMLAPSDLITIESPTKRKVPKVSSHSMFSMPETNWPLLKVTTFLLMDLSMGLKRRLRVSSRISLGPLSTSSSLSVRGRPSAATVLPRSMVIWSAPSEARTTSGASARRTTVNSSAKRPRRTSSSRLRFRRSALPLVAKISKLPAL